MDNEIILCTINLGDDADVLDEAMSNFGNKGKAGMCFLKIKGNEGPIPHFHIESRSSGFHTSIRIYEANYSGIHSDDAELSEDQKIILNKAVTEELWKLFCRDWSDLNIRTEGDKRAFKRYLSSIGIDDQSKAVKPDYTMIP